MFTKYPFQDSRLYTSQGKKDLLSDEKQQKKENPFTKCNEHAKLVLVMDTFKVFSAIILAGN